VYLTAALPPILQPAFFRVAGLDVKELDVIYYAAQHCVLGTRICAGRAERSAHESSGSQADEVWHAQILIYCSSVEETKRMGKLLQCSAYYREMSTDEDKSHMVGLGALFHRPAFDDATSKR
jgi:hypothetical protein